MKAVISFLRKAITTCLFYSIEYLSVNYNMVNALTPDWIVPGLKPWVHESRIIRYFS